MSYLLDTNVISELRKSARRADPAVRAWAASRMTADLYLSVITVMEIEVGIGRLRQRDPLQAQRLQRWLDDDVLDAFDGRILSVDLPVARRTARLHVPDQQPERDALIAATASIHGMPVATRNVRDFEHLGIAVVNPWEHNASPEASA